VQILVDASVWLAYFQGAATPETDHLDTLLGRAALVVADVVLAEVLHALPDELHRRRARAALAQFWRVEVTGFPLAEKAAVNYHTLRARGIEAGANECRLATFCLEEGFALLHASGAYDPFEQHLGLRVARG
jgi:predicted nucleic acid-binding protein